MINMRINDEFVADANPPFDVGQKVICTDGDFCEAMAGLRNEYVLPKQGETYTIRAVEPTWHDEGSPWSARLVEVVNPACWYSGLKRKMEAHWSSRRFRPAEA